MGEVCPRCRYVTECVLLDKEYAGIVELHVSCLRALLEAVQDVCHG